VRIFIGFDSRESVAFSVAAHSILSRSSRPVSITPLCLSQLPLKRKPEGSTEFTFSRFLVPWLCSYQGTAVFMDCDVLVRTDITKIIDGLNEREAVAVVKHDYTPKAGPKFLGNEQTLYPRKNWSSVMVFNNPLCYILTPEYVDRESGANLHQFRWLRDWQIGELDRDWNHLVGEYPRNPDAKIAHFTLGTPCFAKYRNCEFSGEWYEEKNKMLDYEKLMEYSRPETEPA
jgi:hypothetical protein